MRNDHIRLLKSVLGPIKLLLFALLPVSFLPAGESPANSIRPHFRDVASESGITEPTVMRGSQEGDFLLSTSGGPVGVFDFNADGRMDIFLGGSGSITPGSHENPFHSRLYENTGGGHFAEVSHEMGADLVGWSQGVCSGDINNDGYSDLIVTFYGRVAVLFNRDGKRLEEIAASELGLEVTENRWNSGCTLLDYDKDGYLDLFITCYARYEQGMKLYERDELSTGVSPVLAGFGGEHNYLFRNTGGKRFTDVSQESGILSTEPGLSFTPISLDYNRDGWTDLFVTNDSTPNRLYQNSGNGRFDEIGLLSGIAYNEDARALAGMGVDAADHNSDGYQDLAITNFSNQPVSLFQNFGGRSFLDVTFPGGLGDTIAFVKWGINFFDYDLDGRDDLFYATGPIYPPGLTGSKDSHSGSPNLIYHNAGGRFQQVAASGEEGFPQSAYCSRGSALGDFDDDGQLEIIINNINGPPELWKSSITTGLNWVGLKLQGKESNRSAIGSLVTVMTSGGHQTKEIRAASSFCSQNDPRLHFGLDEASSFTIQIEWPSGTVQKFENVQTLNQYLAITEGERLSTGGAAQ